MAPDTEVFVSAASIWEIAIKYSIGKPDIDPGVPLDSLGPDNGFSDLAILPRHAAAVRDLPRYHADPFDRLLVAQAMLERLTLATADSALAPYRVPTLPAR